MDNEKFTGQEDDNSWFDDLLTKPHTGEEISTDEHAVAPHGMSSISDMELDKIMREAVDGNWGEEEIPETVASEDIPLDDLYADGPADAAAAVPADEEPDASDDEGGVPRKVRPKRKKGYGLFGLPHLACVIIALILGIYIGSELGSFLWVCATDILAFGRHDQSVSITITPSDNLDTITNKLHNAGLIKYPSLFKMYCDLAKVEEKGKISVGTFELNTLYDYHALVGGMSATSSYRETTEVMIPEGYSCAQIFALLEEKGVCSAADLEAYASESEFADYWFLEGVEKGHKYCLEGFLFPDTYEFYTNDTPKRVFIKFLNNFGNQFDEELQNKLTALNERRPSGKELTLAELITVASMVEKESAHSGESVDIASVIYNRLASPNFPFLNIDATVVYALGGKTELTKEDMAVDSPYNTYKYEGLPPGPISNPGLLSILSALEPSDTDYYYYALDPDAESREHKFFRTYQEHLDFINGN